MLENFVYLNLWFNFNYALSSRGLYGKILQNISVAYVFSWRPKMQTSSKALFEYDNEGVIILTSIK